MLLGALVLLPIAAFLLNGAVRDYIASSALDSRAARNAGLPSTPDAGFDLSGLVIPDEEIRRGGPRKDGIPALTDPKMIAANDAAYLSGEDKVIGVAFGGEVRAYPLKILDFHEIVNDSVGGRPVAVTYCPLCDSSVVFDRRDGERTLEFGVSGLLYNSNVLMFDRGNPGEEALWSQMRGGGVSGWASEHSLRKLPMEVTTWNAWQERHPETLVLSADTGHERRYDRSVYAHYFSRDSLMFEVSRSSDRLPPKTPVLCVSYNGVSRAYVIEKLLDQALERQEIGGKGFDLAPDPAARTLRIENAEPGVEWCYSFWFAWYAFHPDTEVVPNPLSDEP